MPVAADSGVGRSRWCGPGHSRRRVVLPSAIVRAEPQVLNGPENYVYDMCMVEHKLHGEPVTEEQIQAWADEAEAGYDLSKLPKPRRGRPPVGEGPGTVVPVRLDAATIAALSARARAEGITTRSEAIRAAVRQWAHIA